MRTPQSIRKYDMISDPRERAYLQLVESIIINENEKQKKKKGETTSEDDTQICKTIQRI